MLPRKAKKQPPETPVEAPRARGIWSGSISFGLVTVPVELYSAVRRARPPLRMLSEDGTPLGREYVCPEHQKPLAADDIERGYEVAEGKFVTLTDEELERLEPRRSRDIELTRFVDRRSLDPAYFERGYFLVPGAEQTKAYRLLAETMEATNRAGIAHFVMRGKAYAVAIMADRGVLRAETLRFGDELRSPTSLELPSEREVDASRLREMKRRLSRLLKKGLDDKELRDEEPEQLLKVARQKLQKGVDVIEAPEAPPEEAAEGAQVIDIMALIKRRLAEGAPEKKPARARSPRPRTKRPARPVRARARRAAARRP